MNNVLIYFCANVQILIRPGTIVFTKSDLTPGEKRRISPRFDLAPGVNPAFLTDSTAHPMQGQIFSLTLEYNPYPFIIRTLERQPDFEVMNCQPFLLLYSALICFLGNSLMLQR